MEPAREPPAIVYAASDYRPRGAEEKDLCDRASKPDYVYILGSFALVAGSIALDTIVRQDDVGASPVMRTLPAGAVGLTWGAFLSGGYLSLPKCLPDFVPPVAPEGSTAQRWPLALAIATVSAISAPVVVYIETGFVRPHWDLTERQVRVALPAVLGFAGALLPWIPALAPRTYRSMLKLENLRIQAAPVPPGASAAPSGVVLGWGGTF